jgi:parvulin-like peptidyl-prolyl isomerase
MAKKSTVGGPRPRQVTVEDIERRKQYKSRAEINKRRELIALVAIGILVAISVILLLGTLTWEKLIVPRQAITKVDGEKIAIRDYQARVRYTRWLTADQIRSAYNSGFFTNEQLSSYAYQLNSPEAIGSQVLDEMEEEIIMRHAAEDLGIKVDDAAVEEQVNQYMSQFEGLPVPVGSTTPTTEPTLTLTPLVSPTPTLEPTATTEPTLVPSVTPLADVPTATEGPTLTPSLVPTETLTPTATSTLTDPEMLSTLDKAASRFYHNAEESADVDRDVVRDVFYRDALQQALIDYLGQDVPTEELQANVRHILIAFIPGDPSGQSGAQPTEEQIAAAEVRANEVMTALQNGEPFADVARLMSDDTNSATNGGELGWSSPTKYVAEFADAVSNSAIGEIVGPVRSQYGFHIIQVEGREIRPVSESDMSTRRNQAFTDWLNEQKASTDIVRKDNWVDYIPDDPSYDELLGDIMPLN